jgi:crossover junction endodeoxyribonuclease RuvC
MILAIDPGFEKVGYAFFENKDREPTFITSGLIKTKKTTEHEKRLLQIYNSLETLIKLHKPKAVAMEQLFFFKNQKTVIPVAQSQGVILLLSAQHNLPVSYITPLQIKQTITGYGNADKKNVLKMIQLILKQNLVIEDDDQSDAIACGLAYCYLNRNLIR